MRLTEFSGRKVVVAGYGREGQAACRTLLKHHPDQPLTVVATERVAIDHEKLTVIQERPDQSRALLEADVIVSSPGISPYRGVLAEAINRGIRVTSGTEVFFAERGGANAVCITGTQGKSTTVALTAHLLSESGRKVIVAGNFGVPLLDVLEERPDWFVVELSSYQTRGLTIAPKVAACLNLHPEHLDWHGSKSQYFADKLDLLRGEAKHLVLNYEDESLRSFGLKRSRTTWFNHRSGVDVADNQFRFLEAPLADTACLPLPGAHNLSNACAALSICALLGVNPESSVRHLKSFVTLPHRLHTVGQIDDVTYIDDSISTTPTAVMAALNSVPELDKVTLLVGGYDRGLDWTECIHHLRAHTPACVIGMYEMGQALVTQMREAGVAAEFHTAERLSAAVTKAQDITTAGGVILLSPGAPSFAEFKNFEERGLAFKAAAGLV